MSVSMCRGAAVVGVGLLWAGAASAGLFEYALDDGAGNFNIGPSTFDAQMLWGNYFDAQPGAETITGVSVSFAGSVPVGREVMLVVFDDPDDDLDPTNAVPVSIGFGVTESAGPNEFLSFDVPDVRVSGGFFVAAVMSLELGQAAARMDPDTNVGRSWLFFDGQVDLDNLGGSPLFYNMSDTPFNGTWMVRAQAVPGVGGSWLLAAGLGVGVRRRRRD